MATGNVREARTVLVTVLVGGDVLVQLADRMFHVHPALDNVLYTVLPPVAGLAATTRALPRP